jgi:hypothetical protein
MAKYFSLKLLRAQQNCHPDRSVAQWRDLLYFSSSSHTDSNVLGYSQPSLRDLSWRSNRMAALDSSSLAEMDAGYLAVVFDLSQRTSCQASVELLCGLAFSSIGA